MQTRLAGERIAIVGMARSGIAAAALCLREKARVIGLDLHPLPEDQEELERLRGLGAELIWGPHPAHILARIDRIVKSPGVPGEIEFLAWARKAEIPIWSELELASRFARGPILAISGTNGKSTTTAWVADMLTRAGRSNELVGNIGRPLSDGVLQAPEGAILVTEVSSFQLEDVETFRPDGAVLLNITPDHLDRHHDLVTYREAKMRIFAQQAPADHAVVGEDDDLAREVMERFAGRMLRFRFEDRGEAGAAVRDGRILQRWRGSERVLIETSGLALPGRHNLSNALASLALLAPLDLPVEALSDSLRRFAGLPHRLERIAEIEGVLYVNDSKATNTDSLGTALAAYDAPLILLAGGRGKGQDFRPLAPRVRERCRKVLLFGEAAPQIREAWGGDLCETLADLEAAVSRARALAREGEIVLLSPACASFDQFKNYEERGKTFRRIVQGLLPGKEGR